MAFNKLAKKISVKTVCGKPPIPKAEAPLMRVLGMAFKTRTVNTQFGDSTGFIGTFEAINLTTGVTFEGSEAWLPDIITGLLVPVVATSENGVQFAFDITYHPAETPTGYEYGIKQLIERATESPLDALRAKLPPLPVMLAAPKNPADASEKSDSKNAPPADKQADGNTTASTASGAEQKGPQGQESASAKSSGKTEK